jgi:ferredoxin-NADP reductase
MQTAVTALMPVVKLTGKISRIAQQTPTVRSYTIDLPKGTEFTYLPGQFVSVRFTNGGTVHGPRSFSISSSPTERNSIELTIKKTGEFTTALWELTEGHELQLTGPFGLFYLDPDKARDRDICFIAGGTGIAPLLSMLRWAQDKGLPNRFILLYSVRTAEDVIYALELAERSAASENLTAVITLTRQEHAKGWKGEYGRINADKIHRYIPNLKQTDFFICGPPEMVNAVVKTLFDLGVERGHVKIERWE